MSETPLSARRLLGLLQKAEGVEDKEQVVKTLR